MGIYCWRQVIARKKNEMGNDFVGDPEHIFGPTNHILRESPSADFFEKNIFLVEISTPVEISTLEV